MKHPTEPKTDSIIINKTLIQKISAIVLLSITFFSIGIFIEAITMLYVVCGLFSTPIICAYLITKYLFGGERQSKRKD